MSQAAKIKSTVENVTPAKAKKYLDSMGRNRRLKKSVVARFVKDIQSGKWQLTGQPIVFDKNKKLIDGQHRLQACIDAKKPILLLIVRGVAPKAYEKMDIGTARTAGDVLSSAGFGRANQTAGAVRTLIGLGRIEANENKSHSQVKWAKDITHTEILMFARKHADELADATEEIQQGISLLRPSSLFIALRVRFGWSNETRAFEFFDGLISGADMDAEDPRMKLRNVLIRDLGSKTDKKKSIPWKAAVTIKAWNAWLKGESMSYCRYSDAEGFPKVRARG